jgi:hypothetical protein
MSVLKFLSIKASNLKCFGQTPQGFDVIRPVNIIIGRNNTGKTTLLDMLEFAQEPSNEADLRNRGRQPEVMITVKIDDKLHSYIRTVCQDLLNYSAYVVAHRDKQGFSWRILPERDVEFSPPSSWRYPSNDTEAERVRQQIVSLLVDPFREAMSIIRIASDRDIRPETDKDPVGPPGQAGLKPAGDGATRIMARMLSNDIHENRMIIE